MNQDKSEINNLTTQTRPSQKGGKKKIIIISTIVCLVLMIAAVSFYIFFYVPYQEAVALFNTAVNEFNTEVAGLDKRNDELDKSIESLSLVINTDNIPIDELLLAEPRSVLDAARNLPKDIAPELPKMPKNTADITTAASQIVELAKAVHELGDYSTTLETLAATEAEYNDLINQFTEARADMLWYGVDEEYTVLRFAVQISNSNPYALTGITTEWTAYDKDDAVVGYFEGSQPDIPANSCIYYVGGAGGVNLSGTPARVEVKIVNKGLMTSRVAPQISVSNIQLKDKGYNFYEVFADCITDSEIQTADLNGVFILKDDKGTILDADFWNADNLPKSIKAEGKFKISNSFFDTPAIPKNAEVFVYHVCN